MGSPCFSLRDDDRFRLLSGMHRRVKSPEKCGREVQVGNNFIVVYPNAKFPTREVIYADSDYITETRMNQNANSKKTGISYDTILGREAKVITHRTVDS